MCFIERETHDFILKLMEIFPWRETVLSVHGIKSDKNPFFCQMYATFLIKMVHVVIDRYFPLFSKGLKSFLSPVLSLIVPLTENFINTVVVFNLCLRILGFLPSRTVRKGDKIGCAQDYLILTVLTCVYAWVGECIYMINFATNIQMSCSVCFIA